MVDKKWDEIASGINALGVDASLTTDQVKKKWINLKSKSKKSVAKYKAELKKTGGGSNGAEKPSNMQFRVAEIIGGVYTNGVPGTTTCDTSVSSEGIIEEKSFTNSPTSSTESGYFLNLSPSRQDDNAIASKRRKSDSATLEILQVGKNIQKSVKLIQEELHETNAALKDIVTEFGKVSGSLEKIACALCNHYGSFTDSLNS